MPPLSDPLSEIMSAGQAYADYTEDFGLYSGEVPATVSRLVLALDDGETVTVPTVTPASDMASAPERYVAFALPSGLGIKIVTVYTDLGAELGYSIPFNAVGFPIIESWYTLAHPPMTSASGSGTTSGSLDGTAWSFTAWAGQFGDCDAFTMLPTYSGTAGCTKQLVPPIRSVDFPVLQLGPHREVIVYAAVDGTVGEVDLTLSDGTTVTPKLLNIGPIAYYVGVYPPGTKITEITTYDTDGYVLAQAHA